ncbi:unnamed protein product [Symbiodinium sp. CCMP2592]|nr:unnamed protein product [Symbiodinium sp. CCMP2592]
MGLNWHWFYAEAKKLDEQSFRFLVDYVADLLDKEPVVTPSLGFSDPLGLSKLDDPEDGESSKSHDAEEVKPEDGESSKSHDAEEVKPEDPSKKLEEKEAARKKAAKAAAIGVRAAEAEARQRRALLSCGVRPRDSQEEAEC